MPQTLRAPSAARKSANMLGAAIADVLYGVRRRMSMRRDVARVPKFLSDLLNGSTSTRTSYPLILGACTLSFSQRGTVSASLVIALNSDHLCGFHRVRASAPTCRKAGMLLHRAREQAGLLGANRPRGWV
jgi:hypothetical protein